jgi:hypothetical protein
MWVVSFDLLFVNYYSTTNVKIIKKKEKKKKKKRKVDTKFIAHGAFLEQP